ncbi:MAG TPA: hypothetical protein VGM30_16850 [Puia sp.]|jgi:hypothetical protein
MTNKEFSSIEVEKLTRSSLPAPSDDLVGQYYKIPYNDAPDPSVPAPAEAPKSWKNGVFKLTEKMEWIFIGIGLIQPEGSL